MNDKGAIKIICRNRKAYFEYAIDALYEAGLVLKGTEVKSLRQGKANIDDAFARFQGNELFLYNAHISPYSFAGPESHNPERPRKLLLHRWEMRRLLGKLQERGSSSTAAPTSGCTPGRICASRSRLAAWLEARRLGSSSSWS